MTRSRTSSVKIYTFNCLCVAWWPNVLPGKSNCILVLKLAPHYIALLIKLQTDRTNSFCKGDALLIKAKHALHHNSNTHCHNNSSFAPTSSPARETNLLNICIFIFHSSICTHMILLPGQCTVCNNSCIAAGRCCIRKSNRRQMYGNPKSTSRQYIQFRSKSIKYYSSKIERVFNTFTSVNVWKYLTSCL